MNLHDLTESVIIQIQPPQLNSSKAYRPTIMVKILDYRLGSSKVAELVGVPFRTLDHWVRTGIVSCEIPAQGAGTRRRFGFRDIFRVQLVARLRKEGISLQTIRKAVALLQQEWKVDDPLVQAQMLSIDERLYWAENPEILWDILKRQGAAGRLVVIDMQELARDTEKKVDLLLAAERPSESLGAVVGVR